MAVLAVAAAVRGGRAVAMAVAAVVAVTPVVVALVRITLAVVLAAISIASHRVIALPSAAAAVSSMERWNLPRPATAQMVTLRVPPSPYLGIRR